MHRRLVGHADRDAGVVDQYHLFSVMSVVVLSLPRRPSGGPQQRGVQGEARPERHHDGGPARRGAARPRAARPAPAARWPTSSCPGRRAPPARRPARRAAGRAAAATVSRMRGPPGCTAHASTSAIVRSLRASRSVTSPRTCRASTRGTSGDSPIRKPRSVTSHVMWSAVRRVGEGGHVDGLQGRAVAGPLRAPRPRPRPRRRTGRARPPGPRSSVGGCTCSEVSSQHSSTAGRRRLTT